MRIHTLIENTTASPEYTSEHGLSLWIEYRNRNILFDLGGSSLFVQNAKTMGIDLAAVDAVVISHGHADHGGGLEAFLECNHRAKIYIHKEAFQPHYSKRSDGYAFIGLDERFKDHPQIVLTNGDTSLDTGVFLFAEVSGSRYMPSMNQNLYQGEEHRELDTFAHEQHLVIVDAGMTLLVIGCGHRGVVNILTHAHEQYGVNPTHVVGGFHMSSRASIQGEDPTIIAAVARELKKTKAIFYTGHCTGFEAYRILKKQLGKRLQKLTTGAIIRISKGESS
jgi:7,8-dihydropterin-6-yl-methyl-4-(beta-D-ribofuranosyl)aminobenzene 5'-phosphate synthase